MQQKLPIHDLLLLKLQAIFGYKKSYIIYKYINIIYVWLTGPVGTSGIAGTSSTSTTSTSSTNSTQYHYYAYTYY